MTPEQKTSVDSAFSTDDPIFHFNNNLGKSMKTSFLNGRDNALTNIDISVLDNTFGEIVNYFNIAWLEDKNPNNKIQELWNRKDYLATNELFMLGTALQKLKCNNHAWLVDNINKIKSQNKLIHSGNLFEILALSIFQREGQLVDAAKVNFPGIDGIIHQDGGSSIAVSLKDFGSSAHNSFFAEKSAQMEKFITSEFVRMKRSGLFSYLHIGKCLTDSEWMVMKGEVNSVLHNILYRKYPINYSYSLKYESTLHFSDIKYLINGLTLSKEGISCAVAITQSPHLNEQKNIETKIADACANFEKHTKLIPETFFRMLFMRIPETVSIPSCHEELSRWFLQRPESTIDFVFLYQPVVARLPSGESQIFHVTDLFIRDIRSVIERKHKLITFGFPVGSCLDKPPKFRTMNGVFRNGCYGFQRGDIYIEAKTVTNDYIDLEDSCPAPGVRTHTIATLPGQKVRRIFSSKFPPHEQLVLFP